MQGTLAEIDIRSILQLIELGQQTGELYVEASPLAQQSSQQDCYEDKASFWLVCFTNGKITYAADRDHQTVERLREHLRHYQIDDPLDHCAEEVNSPLEYSCLWKLLEKGVLTPAQGKRILTRMSQETLFDLLSLHQGQFTFKVGSTLAPQLDSWEIKPLVTKIVQQVQQWKQLHPFIQSYSQRPLITNEAQLQASLPQSTFASLQRWVDGQHSLRQLSRYLDRPLVVVAQAIHLYLQRGWMQMDLPKMSVNLHHSKTPRIVCLDDELVIRDKVAQMLESLHCETITLEKAMTFLSETFRLKPDLILCDITMPELDGYQICAMLRSTFAFRQTPIIMLTGKEGYLDRVRARMVGATDYLTKPFNQAELVTLIGKYLDIESATPPLSTSPVSD